MLSKRHKPSASASLVYQKAHGNGTAGSKRESKGFFASLFSARDPVHKTEARASMPSIPSNREFRSVSPQLLHDPAFSPDPRLNPHYGQVAVNPGIGRPFSFHPTSQASSTSPFPSDAPPPTNSNSSPSVTWTSPSQSTSTLMSTTTISSQKQQSPPLPTPSGMVQSYPPHSDRPSPSTSQSQQSLTKSQSEKSLPRFNIMNPSEPPPPSYETSLMVDNEPRPPPIRVISTPEVHDVEPRPALPQRAATAPENNTLSPGYDKRHAASARELDRIDELDESSPTGLTVHHRGPYEAALLVGRQLPSPPEPDRSPRLDLPVSSLQSFQRNSMISVPQVQFGAPLNLSPGQVLPRNFYPYQPPAQVLTASHDRFPPYEQQPQRMRTHPNHTPNLSTPDLRQLNDLSSIKPIQNQYPREFEPPRPPGEVGYSESESDAAYGGIEVDNPKLDSAILVPSLRSPLTVQGQLPPATQQLATHSPQANGHMMPNIPLRPSEPYSLPPGAAMPNTEPIEIPHRRPPHDYVAGPPPRQDVPAPMPPITGNHTGQQSRPPSIQASTLSFDNHRYRPQPSHVPKRLIMPTPLQSAPANPTPHPPNQRFSQQHPPRHPPVSPPRNVPTRSMTLDPRQARSPEPLLDDSAKKVLRKRSIVTPSPQPFPPPVSTTTEVSFSANVNYMGPRAGVLPGANVGVLKKAPKRVLSKKMK